MNKTALKFFLSCAAVAAVTALILLLLNFAGLLYISYDNGTAATRSNKRVIDLMHSAYESGEDASVLLPEGYWCILLDDGGDVIWSADMPDDIPQHYTLRDVAVLSRWFLCDYPVYTQAEDCGLFILGQPKKRGREISDSPFDELVPFAACTHRAGAGAERRAGAWPVAAHRPSAV